MDDQLEYDERQDEQFLIGNLLADDDTYTPTKDVRNIQRSNLQSTFSTPITSTSPWSNTLFQQSEWNPLTSSSSPFSTDWTNFTSNNILPSYEGARYPPSVPLSLNFTPNNYIQAKPTATVPPFQTLNDLNKSDDTSSPVSDERSDSGTISPDNTRPKQHIKWKKVDLSSFENPTKKPEKIARQSSEVVAPATNGKTWSSVAQVNGHQQHQQHKRLGATSSVPISKPNNLHHHHQQQQQKVLHGNKKSYNNSTRPSTQPVTPDEPPKPSKIVGLNPISSNSTTAAHVNEPQKVHIPASAAAAAAANAVTTTTATATTVPDFQKIKRKKKGKTNSKKADAKQEQKPGSRYLALIQSDFTNADDDLSLENGPSEDEDDDFDETEYRRQEEEEKEQIRQQARQQFENEKVSEEEANEKMKKLENEIRVIFEKRKTAKQQRISSQRHRRRKNGYHVWIPAILSALTSTIVSAFYRAFTFFFSLVANVMVLSYHALTDSFTSLIFNLQHFISSFFVGTLGTVFNNSIHFIENIKQCGGIECQVGLSSNAPFPHHCEDVLERLYQCPNADAFSVLGLTKNASIEEIEIHFKKNCAAINPKKRFNVGCEEAQILLQTAFELICEEEKKQEYLSNIRLLPQTFVLQAQLDDFRSLINRKGAILHCECNENHPITRVSSYDGRFCCKCNQTHSVKNGDLWVDKQYFGWVLTYYAVINNTVYDVTDWASCAVNCWKRSKCNPHMITHRLYNLNANAAVTNGTEKHQCSCNPSSSSVTRSSSLPPKDELPWQYSCCCSLIVCPPNDPSSVREIPCCFGAMFVPISTTAAPFTAAEKLTDNDRPRKGRRRRYR